MPEGKNFFNLSSRKEVVFEEIEPTKQVEVRICHSFRFFVSFLPLHVYMWFFVLFCWLRGFLMFSAAIYHLFVRGLQLVEPAWSIDHDC
jgi:hypothetical protein